jgi:hypothetical protein
LYTCRTGTAVQSGGLNWPTVTEVYLEPNNLVSPGPVVYSWVIVGNVIFQLSQSKEGKSELSVSHFDNTQSQEEEAVQNCQVQQVKA